MTKLKLKKKYRKLFLNILLITLIILFLFATYKSIKFYYYGNKSKKINDELVKKVVDYDKKTKKTSIDFDKLKKINVDIVGWIMIPNTNINYPIMQTFDNTYYLTRDFNNQYNLHGSIFMDYKNRFDFSDANTVLYGHNTSQTDMFSDLKKVYNGEYKDNMDIYIYTPNGDYVYTLYSMYLTDPNDGESVNLSTSYFTKSEKDFNIDIEKEKIQHTLTLSTCYSDSKKRIILHAYLNQDNQKES